MTTTTTAPSVPSATVESGTAATKIKHPKKRSNTTNNASSNSPSSDHQQPAPKRRKGSTTTTTKTNGGTETTAQRLLQPTIPPPTNILIVDNGGDTVKYGWASTNPSSTSSSSEQPKLMTNITARLQHQWTVLVGDEWEEYSQQHAASSSAVLSRSFERGIMVNLGHQVMVWKRILDVLGVAVVISNKNAETAQALGWKNSSNSNNNKKALQQQQQQTVVAASSCAVLLLLPPYCPRVIIDQIFHVWLEDFGFSHVGFALSSVCAAHAMIPPTVPSSDSDTGCVCLVDLGWSAVHVVPTYQGELIVPTSTTTAAATFNKPTTSCIRRVPLGGRHLINLWKYTTTYRQWNLMDQEMLLRQVHHQLAFVALNFTSELQSARQRPAGQRPYDREVVLPDFQTTFECKIQIPPALRKRQQQEQNAVKPDTNDEYGEDEENNYVTGNERNKSNSQDEKEQHGQGDGGHEGDSDKDEKNRDEDDEDDDDEEEEAVEEKRKRLLKQRQEEEERRRDQQQMLQVSVERFTIPEVLFRPSDAGLPESMAGIPQAIVQAILACPRQFQAALFQSIHLVGGVAQLKNLPARLQKEVRSLAPTQYQVTVTVSSQPVTQAWKGAQAFVNQAPFERWAWSKQDWLQRVSKKSTHHATTLTQTSVPPSSASSHGMYAKLILKNPGMFV
jgi:actin-related protein